MKKETGKKSKLWIVLLALLVLLLAAGGVVLALFLGGQGTDDPGPAESPLRAELYWNVDRIQFTENSETGLSTRTAAEDGQFHIRFAYNGELVDLIAADKKVVNIIDTQDVMGLEFDADGRIIGIVQPLTIATEVGKRVYVQYVEGDTIITNSSLAMNGMEMPIKVSELTGIYEVDPTNEKLGKALKPEELKPFDCVTIYANANGDNTHVYVISHSKSSKMYFRTEQWYDSSNKKTTRTPDENGVYSIDFFCDGERVTLHTKDAELLRKIDSLNFHAAYTGLTFDENGMFDSVMEVSVGLGGMRSVYCMEVDSVDGRTAYLKNIYNSNGPTEQTITIPESCPIYDMSAAAEAEGRQGEAVDMVTPGDRITVWSDMQGNPLLTIITLHRVDMKPYYSPTRKYNSTTHETTRVRGEDGYYTINLVAEGEGQKTYRIQDEKVAQYIDRYAERTVGIVTQGDVIIRAYDYESIFGYTRFCTALWVDSINGSIIGASTGNGSNTYNFMISPDCKVIDVSDTTVPGDPTELRPGDRIIAFRNTLKEICLIWVAGRTFEDADFYVNVTRKYDSTKKETTRTPDEAGYYVFEMANRGKPVTVRTKSKALASKIDSYGVRVMGMYVSGGIAKQAFYGGHVTGGWIDLYNGTVTEVLSDTEIQYVNENTTEPTYVYKMNADYECYNIGTAVYSHVGEKTTPKVGDKIMIYNDRADMGEAMFILSREPHNGLYWNKEPMYDANKKETARKPDASGYYVYEMSYLGKTVTLKTKDKKVADTLDSNSYGVVLVLDGNIIRSVSSHSYAKDIKTLKYGAWDVTSVSGSKVNLRFNRFAEAFGSTASFNLSSTRIYDVSPTASRFGQATTLRPGDRVRVYTDDFDRVSYVYIVCRDATRYKYCDHCDKTVMWSAWTGSSFDTYSGHHFLPCDRTIYTQYACGTKSRDFEAVLDLNGHTITRNGGGRMFVVLYGDKLTVLDSVGDGVIQGMGGKDMLGNVFLVSEDATLTLLSGTLKNIGTDEEGSARGGVVYAYGDKTTFNMYGGEIVGGKMLKTEKYESTFGSAYIYKATFNMYGGKIYGGQASVGGNVYLADKSKFNMYGGTITGGIAEKNGGNVYASSNTVTNLEGGIITDGVCGNVAGNFFATTNSIINISGEIKDEEYVGAIIAYGSAVPQADPETGELKATYGGNVYLDNAILNVNGGALVGGSATRGGNVNVGGAKSELNINGGFLLEGAAGEGGTSGQGGNIRVASACVINLNGGVIANGTTTNTGGNIFMGYGAKLNVTNGGEIVGGGKPAEGATTTCNYGGNIYAYGGDCEINVTGAKVYGGFSRGRTANICMATASEVGAKLNLVDAELDGCVQVSKASTITVSGATKLSGVNGGLDLRSGSLMVMNELTEGAEICVNADGAFTVENKNAAKYLEAGYIKGATEYITITEQDDVLYATQPDASRFNDVYEKAVEMTEKDTFASGEIVNAECPYCEMMVGWEPLPALTGEEKLVMNTSAHYYLAEGVKYESALDNVYYWLDSKASVCLHLNGQSINNSGESVFTVRQGCTLTVMGDGTVQGLGGGEHKNFNGGALDLLAGTVNLCGGTYMTTGATPIIATRGNSASLISNINIFNGTKVQGDADNTISSLYLFGAANVNMYGGEIKDGIAEGKYGGNVQMSSIYATKFNLYGGTVSGGTSEQGGNFRIAGGSLNIYGGAVEAGVTTNTGGNVFLLANATLNMEGGSVQNGQAPNGSGGNVYSYGLNTIKLSGDATITGGNSKNGGGQNIYMLNADDAGTKLIMNGGSIEGSVYVSTLSSVELSGAPKIGAAHGALYMGSDATNASKITLGELVEGTEVYVTANGVFTEVNPKAADYLKAGYFKPAVATSTIQERDGVLFIDNGDTTAVCSVCGESVTWKVLPELGASKLVLNQSGHYYLAEDGNYDSSAYAESFYEIDGKATICLDLKGKTITSGNRTFFGRIGTTLNVMGEGTIQGAGAGVHKNFNGGAFDMLGATVNLYGGTYKTTGAAPIISTRSQYESTLNIYDGATIQGDADNTISSLYLYGAATVNMYGGTITGGVAEGNYGGNVYMADAYETEFNLYGGTISGGTSNQGGNFRIAEGTLNVSGGTITGGISSGNGGNVFLFNGATLNMEGGSVENGAANGGSGGNVYAYGAATVKVSGDAIISGATSKNGGGKNVYFMKTGDEISTFEMNGGSIANSVFISSATNATLSGAPTIGAANGALYIMEGAKLTLGELTEGTEVYVTATGVFTEVHPNAAEYLAAGYFKSAVSGTKIFEKDGVLYTSNGNIEKECPVCKETVTWKVLPELGAEKLVLTEGGHYYLAEDGNYDSTANANAFYELDNKAVICLDLNGQTMNSGNRVFSVRQNCVLNVVGEGTVQGVGAGVHKNFNGGAFDLLAGTVNLYGGTYKTTGATPIISTRGTTDAMVSNINIYDGATIQGDADNTISSLYLYGAANVNMYGGTITGGVAEGNYGGNVHISDKFPCVFNIYGGTVSGGKSVQGGNFRIAKGELNVYGGTITGGNADNTGGNVFLLNGATLNMEAGAIENGTATNGSGGNVYAYGAATVKLSGDATISGATAKNGGGKNVYFQKAGEEISTFVMNGGKIANSVVISGNTAAELSGAPKIGSGNGALYIVEGVKLTLGELTEGTEIYVTATGAFTNANEKAAAYVAAGYFKSEVSKSAIYAEDDVLYCRELTAADIFNSAYENAKKMTEEDTFASNGEVKAKCPVCYSNVTWQPLPALGEDVVVIKESGHYYLASNVAYDSQEYDKAFYELDGKATICLHLNGQTITSGNRTFFGRVGTTLNVMGDGTVQGAGAGSHGNFNGGAFDMLGATVNLCGGTYMSTDAAPIVSTRSEYESTLNIYDGCIKGSANNTISSLYLYGAATVNMYGGEIIDGVAEGNYGGNVHMDNKYATEFNLHGGTVSGGTSNQGGNFFVAGKAVVNLLGGTVSGGSAVQGGNIRVSGGTVNVKGATVSGGTATTNNGGNVFLMGGATLNVESGSIKDGAAPASNGGNIFAYGAATVKLSGDATVSGGTSKNGGGKNIYFLKLNDEVSTFEMNGGSVANSVFISANTQATLSGAPTIGAANGGLYIMEGVKLTLGELTEGTEIFVTANGAFTNTNDKAASYLSAGYFKGATAKMTIKESEGVLYAREMTQEDILAEAYEAAKKMTEDGVFASNTTVQAFCPVCYANATWQPLSAVGEAIVDLDENAHYYLASNVTYDSSAIAAAYYEMDNKSNICLHLNGQTVTSGNRVFAIRQECVLNVMGDGTLQGAGAGQHKNFNGGAFDLLAGTVNLFGGTYKTTGATPIISTRGASDTMVSTINIYDGTVQGAATNTISSLYLYGAAKVNMYGGAIADGVAEGKYGGNVYMADKFTYEFNLYDGTVSGGTSNQGGNFRIAGNGALNVYGGSITAGVSSGNGGNVFLFGGAELNMEGGSIENGAANGGSGGNVYAYGAATVKLSGDATISGATSKNGGGKNVYFQDVGTEVSTFEMNGGKIANSVVISENTDVKLSGAPTVGAGNGGMYISEGGKLTLGELTDGAEIYVTAFTGFTVANEKAAEYAKYFKSVDGRNIIVKENVLWVASAAEEAVLMTTNGVFTGEKVTAKCPICNENAEWQPLTGATTLNTTNFATGSHFYLASDVQLEAGGSIKTDPTIAKVCLHLNGKSFKQAATATNAIGAVWVVADTELTIMGEGTVVGAGYKVTDTRYLGGAIDARGIVNIYGGTYMSCSSLGRPAVTTMTAGKINMYSGTITRMEGLEVSALMSGNVWLDTAADTEFNMYGGTITGGSALKGGNVYMTRGAFTMYGGTIEKGVATGTVANDGHGGANIHMGGGTFTLKDGIITEGNATLQGGNIRVDGGNFVMEGGTVSNGTAANLGGNFRFGGSKTVVEIKGGQILGGYVPSSGGSIGVVGATVTISGGTIDGSGITQANNATSGGLIYINSGNVTLTGTAVLKNGKASGGVNGVFVNADKTLVVSGGTVQSNIYLNATAKIQLSGAPKLSDVNITKGAKLTLGELTEGAEIFVTATAGAVVAELSADPTAYLAYVKSAVDTLTIQAEGNNLKAVAVTAG